MRVFLTGATGFIGSALVPELIDSGHEVAGLARSDKSAKALASAGARAHRGDLDDPDSLRSGAAESDAVIHTAFNHDFTKYVENCEADRRVIEVLGAALAGTDRPLIITAGAAVRSAHPGQPATEDDPVPSSRFVPRAASEEAAVAVANRGGRVVVIRLSQIHDTARQGLVTLLIEIARQKGVSAYVGDGLSRWPAAHRLDTARLYRLGLEKGAPNGRYHAAAEEGIAARDIAQAIGEGLKIPVVSLTPEQAPEHFGWLAPFVSADMPVSSAKTQAELDWRPTGPGLIDDLRNMRFGG